jgi:hypothetical protein
LLEVFEEITIVSWDQQFFDPIELPGGRKLVTLRDAAQYIMKLPKVEQRAMPWQTAAEVLMLIGERGGDPMMAHIAMMQALQRHEPKAANTSDVAGSIDHAAIVNRVVLFQGSRQKFVADPMRIGVGAGKPSRTSRLAGTRPQTPI